MIDHEEGKVYGLKMTQTMAMAERNSEQNTVSGSQDGGTGAKARLGSIAGPKVVTMVVVGGRWVAGVSPMACQSSSSTRVQIAPKMWSKFLRN